MNTHIHTYTHTQTYTHTHTHTHTHSQEKRKTNMCCCINHSCTAHAATTAVQGVKWNWVIWRAVMDKWWWHSTRTTPFSYTSKKIYLSIFTYLNNLVICVYASLTTYHGTKKVANTHVLQKNTYFSDKTTRLVNKHNTFMCVYHHSSLYGTRSAAGANLVYTCTIGSYDHKA